MTSLRQNRQFINFYQKNLIDLKKRRKKLPKELLKKKKIKSHLFVNLNCKFNSK